MDYKEGIAAVKMAYDIVDYIRNTGVDLKPNGVGKWKANCPFHIEKTPSFTVNENFQNYKCFGCGVSGDLISYVSETENLSFNETLSKLAEERNITLELSEGNESRVDYISLQKILKIAAIYYCHNFDQLEENHPAKKQIIDRGLTFDNKDENALKYGYSKKGANLYNLLKKKNFSDELILESGLCRKSSKTNKFYDFFQSRLMFVFTDRYGRPIGFSSRKLYDDDQGGKYVNSVQSPLFNKDHVLYNHTLARKTSSKANKIFITEGQFDVASFIAVNIPNVVASSGTAFSQDQISECKRMAGDDGKLIFCFDGDSAGINAARKMFLLYPNIHEDAYVVVFPENQDPCDFRMRNGDQALRDYVDNPVSIIEFMLQSVKGKYDLTSVIENSKYIQECAEIIKAIPNLSLRENCMKMVSLEAVVPMDTIREHVEKATPIKFDTPIKTKVDISTNEEDDQKENRKDIAELIELIKQDSYYNVAARFISLGLSRQKWREAVVRSDNLLPEEFHTFLKDLNNYSDKVNIFPEMFDDSDMAKLFIEKEFSPFYKFMDIEELKDQFIYLRNKLENIQKDKDIKKKQRNIYEMLRNNNDDLDYFKKIMEKNVITNA